MLDVYVYGRSRFSLRDKRLFEITEVEIKRVDCILKNLAVLFATIYIPASVKIGVKINRQVSDFKFNFSRRKVVRDCCFDLFSSADWRHFQLSGLYNTYSTCQVRRNAN